MTAARQPDGLPTLHVEPTFNPGVSHGFPEFIENCAAIADYQLAAQRATSLPERRYLESRAARLAGHG
jgi:hypothetical protein